MPTSQWRLARRGLPLVLLAIVVWLNAYIARGFFAVETTARMNSMHGFWTALARWAGSAWWTPNWWPYWDGGLPFEYTYAPLAPGLAAWLAHVLNISALRAVQIVSGCTYCLGPALLYVGTWRLTRLPGWSFVAAIAYSLLSPALLLAPNQGFAISNLWTTERLYLMAVWDETPHMLALALWPVAVWCLYRLLETRRLAWLAGSVLSAAGMVYASAFGATLLAISAVCLIGAMGLDRIRLEALVLAGVLAYFASAVALPPSLIRIIGKASEFAGQGWSVKSWTALAVIGVAWVLVWPWLTRRVNEPWMRFFVLFTLTVVLIVWLYDFTGRQFVPQPGRYKLEMSLGLAVAGVFAVRTRWGRLPVRMQIAFLGLLVALAAEQVVAHRRWAKEVLSDRDITQTIEYRAAEWMDAHLDAQARVLAPGSIAQWLNAFSRRPQWSGASWATAPNLTLRRALDAVYQERGGIEGSLTWFRAYGVAAVIVSGNASPEFWKPFADRTKYDGRLEELWKEDDTTLYRVPLRSASWAHALPEQARPTEHPGSIQRYVAELERERLPGLALAWDGPNRALVRGEVRSGEAVAVQMNYHPGWHAWANGRAVPIERDGIGQIWLRPGCTGSCTVELRYNGGAELILCRWLSVLTLAGAALLLAFSWRSKTQLFQAP